MSEHTSQPLAEDKHSTASNMAEVSGGCFKQLHGPDSRGFSRLSVVVLVIVRCVADHGRIQRTGTGTTVKLLRASAAASWAASWLPSQHFDTWVFILFFLLFVCLFCFLFEANRTPVFRFNRFFLTEQLLKFIVGGSFDSNSTQHCLFPFSFNAAGCTEAYWLWLTVTVGWFNTWSRNNKEQPREATCKL